MVSGPIKSLVNHLCKETLLLLLLFIFLNYLFHSSQLLLVLGLLLSQCLVLSLLIVLALLLSCKSGVNDRHKAFSNVLKLRPSFVENGSIPSNIAICFVIHIVEPKLRIPLFHCACTRRASISYTDPVSALDGGPLGFVREDRFTIYKGSSFF